MFPTTVLVLTLAASALASVFVTNPTASTTCNAGSSCSISWIEGSTSPSLAQFGIANVGLYTGNAIEQTLLQAIATNVNVSSTDTIQFTPNANIGPNGNNYFIRFDSLTDTNVNGSNYPAQAFSAMFNLAGMSGQFNASVQSEINGQSTAPIGGSTPAPTMAMTSMPSAMPMPSSQPSTTATTTNGAGKSAVTTGLVGLVAAAIGAALL